MRTRAVIGANFGDEGKGLFVDYLASQGGDVVVRFNGGCQAGHTVVTPDRRRHVFSHFGSGTFVGLPTFFSQHTIVNPVLFIKEYAELQQHVTAPMVYVHPDAMVTTPWDMNSNQKRELSRDMHKRHGSCGVGVFETINRHKTHPLTMRDLWHGDFYGTINAIRNHYCASDEEVLKQFYQDCEWFAHAVRPGEISMFGDPIFEGAQGLLLDQGNMAMYPHLTPSRCGMHNVRELMWEGSFDPTSIDTYYITRTYLTRHGAGPLPREDKYMGYTDNTNIEHAWQGKLRFAPLIINELQSRVHADCDRPRIIFTHCDQSPAPFGVGWNMSFGPTRNDVVETHKQRMER